MLARFLILIDKEAVTVSHGPLEIRHSMFMKNYRYALYAIQASLVNLPSPRAHILA